jgi:hypothetical protein
VCRMVRAVVVFIVLQLQLCLVSSSPSNVGQFSFECCPLFHEISTGIHHLPHFERLACCPTPALSLCASFDLCSVLVHFFWEVCLLPDPPLSLCCLTLVHHGELDIESVASCPTPILQVWFNIPPPPLLSVLDYTWLFMLFSFVGEVQPAQELCWIMFLGSR